MAARSKPLHILVLADRDWTHHDTGGNGANLDAQISRWVAWGNRVTVVAGDYPGAKRVERFGPLLTVHRMGTRLTVFPKAAWAVLRGVGRDADVVLEVINGITFLTPLWLRKPRVAMVHHVHRELFVGEYPRTGLLLYWVLERLPLLLYRRTPFLTISNSARDELVRDGIPRELVTVEYLGVDPGNFRRGTRSETPRLIFVGPPEGLQARGAAVRRARADPGGHARRGRATATTGPTWRPRSSAGAWATGCGCTATWTSSARPSCTARRG